MSPNIMADEIAEMEEESEEEEGMTAEQKGKLSLSPWIDQGPADV
jgi:hypothetical protein